MNKRNSDVLVIGSGMSGLVAALAAAKRGRKVTILSRGVGALAIGSGCVDILGYVDGQPVTSHPLDALEALPAVHPYRLLGRDRVAAACGFLEDVCAAHGMPLLPMKEGNRLVPSIMGTLKPSGLCPASADGDKLLQAQKVAVATIAGLRDCQPNLIIKQLRRYPALKAIDFTEIVLPSPLGKTHRNITALDLARHVDRPEGLSWLADALKAIAARQDLILLPTVCGVRHFLWKRLEGLLGCPVVEMLSIPPGVSGLRLRACLLDALRGLDVTLLENTTVIRALVEDEHCRGVITAGLDHEHSYHADQIIVATGGFMGDGFSATPGNMQESIFRLPLCLENGEAPSANPADWSEANVFARHAFATLRVRVDEQLRPCSSTGALLLDNVRFVGRSLGGYDFATEKSGNGVALATAWYAAQCV